jgi:hypothetical protein
MWPEGIDKVFVLIHQRKEKERFERLAPHLLARGIPADRVLFCAPTWGSELSNETIFGCYDPFCRPGVPVFTFKARSLSKGEISLVLNFYAAAQAAIQGSMNTVIILESDVWLRDDFVERLSDVMEQVKDKEWDYISLGEGARTRPNGCDPSMYGKTKIYPPNHHFVYRCTDSMVFKVSYLKKILPTLLPFRECLDWELNIQALAHQSKSLWVDPPLVEQGTAVGRQETTLIA